MNKFLVIANNEHPLYEEFRNSDVPFIDPQGQDLLEWKNVDYFEGEFIFDFTILSSQKKRTLLEALSIEFNKPIVSDLTFHWASRKFLKLSNLMGAISCVFPSPTNTYEAHFKNESVHQATNELLSSIGKKVVNKTFLEFGFTYPRVISMIINEAYFALEENLASKEDIDTAMKYGVNYPMGPFEWGDLIGKKYIVKILDELFFVHHDQRYKVSPLLRHEATMKDNL
jgi:3-hydroxybutyryl-CoA dehydrogenase